MIRFSLLSKTESLTSRSERSLSLTSWQFSKRDLGRFRKSLAFWGRVDNALFRIAPVLKRLRWMDVTALRKEGKD